ncbi:NOL1/NOP2/sun family protein [Cardiosporidium cionae]|uniref:NOL1/NOP2/Sun domain family member 4 n=1 Tax=Cardiosporidium cionae TaxID=476202 RepID=A0ABQ7JAC3_9APIC|nr:NOL1/NOP2/sun family protein [Cardiosporidium cionae]|eukprot:KAF8820929.1 NOL1/NOP2/sun family protein [Cardiosporidium cionae]
MFILEITLRERFPTKLFSSGEIQFVGADVTKGEGLGRFAPFDKVLLDAPCSSDQHLLQKSTTSMNRWSAGTPKNNSARQLLMLCVGIGLLKRGGQLLYCTCALSELENDQVIKKLLKQLKGQVCVRSLFIGSVADALKMVIVPYCNSSSQLNYSFADAAKNATLSPNEWLLEKTLYGMLLLPDRSKCGPIYMCLLQKE